MPEGVVAQEASGLAPLEPVHGVPIRHVLITEAVVWEAPPEYWRPDEVVAFWEAWATEGQKTVHRP
ncbi:hypothetical protein BDN72DRAFT_893118 [Pluteus cervinus]|uniref:Uncharacterized protein n=1 Tax=Pluteus cervinus TaxID=181527 RepID=A0ACD3B927_9AGAR|nr:hypothetical protein BDN72DRAFT_893118 [Pluteus cervinus]